MNWQQFLTEKVLKECWDADKRPGGDLPNRTFDNRDDLLDLYEAINRGGKRIEFEEFALTEYQVENPIFITSEHILPEYVPWLFCLNGEDYAERCKMVAEFYGWKADHD